MEAYFHSLLNITSKNTTPYKIDIFSGKRRNRGKKHADKQHHDEENQNQNEKSGLDMLMNETAHLDNFSINHLRAAMGALGLPQKPAKTPEEALSKAYQFWNTQPVPKMGKNYVLAKY